LCGFNAQMKESGAGEAVVIRPITKKENKYPWVPLAALGPLVIGVLYELVVFIGF
jgi:hypothetical protein